MFFYSKSASLMGMKFLPQVSWQLCNNLFTWHLKFWKTKKSAYDFSAWVGCYYLWHAVEAWWWLLYNIHYIKDSCLPTWMNWSWLAFKQITKEGNILPNNPLRFIRQQCIIIRKLCKLIAVTVICFHYTADHWPIL